MSTKEFAELLGALMKTSIGLV